MAKKGPRVNVVVHPGGGWAVKRDNAERASRVFHTQDEAVAFARGVAQRNATELRIQGKNGQWRDTQSFSIPVDSSTLTIKQILDEEWEQHEPALRYLADR